ncbi:RNA-directed DNA polymerase from mobile element jockey-like 31 [Homarus americanus]|uniref:RNA-directed DNA polymerase from mobile element jockey-like 31 n=1 Tax=Homarus americanus TaxID=6706 RepID=A0A8J5JHB3_HOMAM|nr:RNA-directed DNA polymerase from mobile element jockey-like 31 [Homarus americanus]
MVGQGGAAGRALQPEMTVPEPNRTPPLLQLECEEQHITVAITQKKPNVNFEKITLKKTVGPDDLSPYVLRHCANGLAGPLSTVFNTYLIVMLVHKKLSKSDPGNYRPMSLLSVKLVAEEVRRHFHHLNLLSNRQFSFISFRSTSNLPLLLSRDWQDALENGLDTLVIALDIVGAFDRVWHGGLLEKFRAKGIEGKLLLLLADYHRGRTLRVVVNGQTSRDFPIEASVPQGSVLGSILGNVYIDDLLQHMPVVSAYADDCTLLCSYPRQDSQRAVQRVNQQLELILRRSTRNTSDGDIPFPGGRPSSEWTLTKHLRFDKHFNNCARKASLRVSALRRLTRFFDYSEILTLYEALIRPYLEYSFQSWMSGAPESPQW